MSSRPIIKFHARGRMTLEPREPERETLIRLTPKGQRFAAQLEGKSEKQQLKMVRERYGELSLKDALRENEEYRKSQGIAHRKKAQILEKLRTAGPDEPVMFQNICVPLNLAIEEAMLLIFEINNFCISLLDAPEDRTFISLFFNGDTGEVWAELFDGDKPCASKGGTR